MMAVARANLEEAAHALRAYAARVEDDPARLEQVENRLQELTRLKRKYGGTLEAAIEIARATPARRSRSSMLYRKAAPRPKRNCSGRSTNYSNGPTRCMRDEKAAARISSAGWKPSSKPSGCAMRSSPRAWAGWPRTAPTSCAIAALWDPLVTTRLSSGSRRIWGSRPCRWPNRVGRRAVARMLALKRLEAQHRGVATMIFDEVDAGIGGAVAEIVGRKLNQLARYHQILCVTHLAQIAAFADSHFVVEKSERRGATRSRVAALKSLDRPAEIARMLGGDRVQRQIPARRP